MFSVVFFDSYSIVLAALGVFFDSLGFLLHSLDGFRWFQRFSWIFTPFTRFALDAGWPSISDNLGCRMTTDALCNRNEFSYYTKKATQTGCFYSHKLSRTISRVMSVCRICKRMIIFLEWLLPDTSSDLPKAGGPRQRFCSVLLRMGFTYALLVTKKAVVSYTALPTLPADACGIHLAFCGGIFLLHFP